MKRTSRFTVVMGLLIAMVMGVASPATSVTATGAADAATSAAVATAATAATATPQRPEGVITPEKPFLKLPFKKALSDKLNVTQGWGEEATEASIIGEGEHRAIDFEGYPSNAPVLAAADGWAYSSYQRIIIPVDYVDPVSGRHVEYIDVGAGLFVEIVHDARAKGVPGDPHWVTQYVHLSRIAKGIPLAKNAAGESAIPDGTTTLPDGTEVTNFYPAGIMQPQANLIKIGKRVRQGDVIGYQGDTGIGANWYDNWDGQTVIPRDRLANPPWDPQGAELVGPKWANQLHFNLYAGRGADGLQGQQNRIDSFDLYDTSDLGILPGHTYRNPYMKGGEPYAGPRQSRTAFKRNAKGQLLFAG